MAFSMEELQHRRERDEKNQKQIRKNITPIEGDENPILKPEVQAWIQDGIENACC